MKKANKLFIFMIFMLLFFPRLNAQSDFMFLDTEKTISMDFKDAGLKDVMKIFSIQSGMNFIASEAVQDRKITVYLNNVPVQEAMDKLFMANNLSYDLDRKANIFIVKDWGKPEIETVVKVFYLKYASVSVSSLKSDMSEQLKSSPLLSGAAAAMEVAAGAAGDSGKGGKWKVEESAGITEVVKKLLSEHGSVIEDFRTNSLIVREMPSRMPVISQAIAALDVSVPQVMLEVEILDVSKNAVDKLGIKFPESLAQLDMTTAARMTKFPLGDKGTSGRGWTMEREEPTVGGWKVDAWPASKFGPTIFSVLNTQIAFDFLRTLSDTKYLARPRILTLNNEPAEIKIVTNEAIGVGKTTTSVEGSTSILEGAERVETGIALRVTPQINLETGEITMFIYPSVSEATTGGTFGTQTFKDPEIRSTKCVVRVRDAETIVVGGLIRSDFSQTRTKVPILGDIPFLGGLFRHRDKDRGKERELLVFITPHILKDPVRELARVNKGRLPEREQESAFSINRQEAISNSLNKFETTTY
jgi:type II secretory pathway component GspD/PulD (secretin)